MDEAEYTKWEKRRPGYKERLSADLKIFKTIQQSFSILFKHFWIVFELMFLAGVIASAVVAFFVGQLLIFGALYSPDSSSAPNQILATLPSILSFIIFEVMLLSIFSGTFALTGYLSQLGGRIVFREILQKCWQRLLPTVGVLVLSLLITIIISVPTIIIIIIMITVSADSAIWLILGFINLIIALMVWMMIFIAIPICIIENTGVIDSLKRSKKLTRLNRFRIFMILFLLSLINIISTYLNTGIINIGIINIAFNFSPQLFLGLFTYPFVFSEFLLDLINLMHAALVMLLSGVVYFNLRQIHGGAETEPSTHS